MLVVVLLLLEVLSRRCGCWEGRWCEVCGGFSVGGGDDYDHDDNDHNYDDGDDDDNDDDDDDDKDDDFDDDNNAEDGDANHNSDAWRMLLVPCEPHQDALKRWYLPLSSSGHTRDVKFAAPTTPDVCERLQMQ